jgi:hypothetical protein
MARCISCFAETPMYWHALRGHFCSLACAEHALGVATIDLQRLVESASMATSSTADTATGPGTSSGFESLETEELGLVEGPYGE